MGGLCTPDSVLRRKKRESARAVFPQICGVKAAGECAGGSHAGGAGCLRGLAAIGGPPVRKGAQQGGAGRSGASEIQTARRRTLGGD